MQNNRAIEVVNNLFILWILQRSISNIEARLQGVVVGVGATPPLPLAVEGQARSH